MLSSTTVLLALSISAFAAPIQIQRREVPQEHSHEPFLKAVTTLVNTNNPDQLGDSVFGLLGNAAAAKGLGKTTDPDCLQQALADRAFTNAKAKGDVDGQVSALIYRALERNSGSVGALSNQCTSVQAVNPEIAAIKQHQDPASNNAAATNKAIVLELAKQIASVGGDPQDALQSGTFAPGQIGDTTAKGNTCDDIVDVGCIVAQNLLVEDATADEINAAVAGVSSGNAGNNTGTAGNAGSSTSTDNTNTGAAAGNVGDFGSCSVPQIEFGQGFDNRKETSFQPADKASFNHGSAQAIGIISQFICDTLTNKCGADQTAKDTCKQAQTAAGAATAKTGAQADAFNAAFGVQTNFANVQPIDDQGRAVGSAPAAPAAPPAAPPATPAAPPAPAAPAAGGAAAGKGNFGKCTVPEIEFGQGFDNRKETSFQPADKASFNHGSAQAIGIIAQFICDTLTNSCGADQAAKDTCKQAQTAAGAATAKTGAQADAFNAAFGIKTNFANVQPIDDQGRAVGSVKARAAGNFGKCTVPEIEFGQGFDNRKETSFQPADKASFNHGSAQAIGIIAQFICDTLTNSCGADQAAKNTCKQAQTAAGAATAKTGAQADAFNAAFGIKTNFANVQPIDDQGRAVGAAAGGATNNGNANTGNANTGNANAGNANSGNAANGAASGNLQKFAGNLGATAPAVTAGGKGFQVAGSDDFLNVAAALGRSCDIQHNACANAANTGGAFSVADCDTQNSACRTAI